MKAGAGRQAEKEKSRQDEYGPTPRLVPQNASMEVQSPAQMKARPQSSIDSSSVQQQKQQQREQESNLLSLLDETGIRTSEYVANFNDTITAEGPHGC